jgi:hypothetical protein
VCAKIGSDNGQLILAKAKKQIEGEPSTLPSKWATPSYFFSFAFHLLFVA